MSEGHVHHPRHHVVPGHGVVQFMERVARLVDGDLTPPPVRWVVPAPRSLADATDEWVAVRAMAEQVLSEANAMLPVGWEHLRLDDEPAVAGLGLAFSLHGPNGWVRVSMRSGDGLAWVGCESTLADTPEGFELAEPDVLEDVALHLLHRPAPFA